MYLLHRVVCLLVIKETFVRSDKIKEAKGQCEMVNVSRIFNVHSTATNFITDMVLYVVV